MAYSTAFSQAISILLLVHVKMQEYGYEFVPTKIISEDLFIPTSTTVKVIKNLTTAGILATKEGAKGGVLLQKPAGKITLLDIFFAIEHESPLFKTQLDVACTGKQVDAFRTRIVHSLEGAEKAMKNSLKGTTLLDIYKG